MRLGGRPAPDSPATSYLTIQTFYLRLSLLYRHSLKRYSVVRGKWFSAAQVRPQFWLYPKSAKSIKSKYRERHKFPHPSQEDDCMARNAKPARKAPAVKALSQRKAWLALKANYKSVQGLHLKELFAKDPKRAQKFTVEALGIY